MTNRREWVWDTLSTALGLLIGGSILFFGYRGLAYLPCLENWISPIVELSEARDFQRDDDRACWTFDLKKLHSGRPVRYEFFAEVPRMSPKLGISVETFDKDGHRIPNIFQDHRAGSTWSRRYCFELSTIGAASDQPITISGRLLYSRHPFYLSEAPIPPFTLPAGTP